MMIEEYDPSDVSNKTIQDLFYRQIRSLSVKPEERMKTFDMQFSDSWF
ncbi:hypothetical protein HQ545_05275 [Candidatus Woesearchaeota archaeon]|nr:hypothetical protein [Candidatus Woesearchaeota archaeon]